MAAPELSRPLHVLHVLGNAITGGMEHWVLRLAQALPRERFRTSAAVPFESPVAERLRDAGVAVHVVPVPADPPWSSIRAVAAIARTGSAELLHAHMPHAHALAALAGQAASLPVLTTIHARELSTLDVELHRAFGSHVSTVCRDSWWQALSLGLDPRYLSCEPNGVDAEAFRPQPRGGALRAALGLAADARLIGCVGRLSPEKGPEVLVRAMLLLQRTRPDTHAVFVGSGPMHGELQRLAASLGVADRVHWAGPRDDLPALHAEFDLVASPSHTEAMPLALLEAMACARPVVATRTGGVPELVVPGETGLLVAPGDFDGLAQACDHLLADPARRDAMGRAARQRVQRHFSLADAAARVGALQHRLARPPAVSAVRHSA